MAASAKLMTAVLAALKESGVAENDIQTSRLSLQPIREQNKNPANIIAVEASSLVTVRLRDISKSADVLDKMISAGANVVTGISFDISEPSKLLDQARTEAIADAKRKAEIYAKAAGVSLGRPLSISEGHVARPMGAETRCAPHRPRCRSSPAKKKSGSACRSATNCCG